MGGSDTKRGAESRGRAAGSTQQRRSSLYPPPQPTQRHPSACSHAPVCQLPPLRVDRLLRLAASPPYWGSPDSVPEWLRGFPAKELQKCARVRTSLSNIFTPPKLHFLQSMCSC